MRLILLYLLTNSENVITIVDTGLYRKGDVMARTLNLIVRVTEKEKALIEDAAHREGLNVSEYIRLAVVMDMALHGPKKKTWKLILENTVHKVYEKFDKRLCDIDDNTNAPPGHRYFEKIING